VEQRHRHRSGGGSPGDYEAPVAPTLVTSRGLKETLGGRASFPRRALRFHRLSLVLPQQHLQPHSYPQYG